MLSLFNHLKEDDLFNVSSFLLKRLKSKFTNIGLSDEQKNHVEYPSLLSLKDSLTEYGIKSLAIKKGHHRYEEFETPFISSIQKEGWSKANFTVVTRAEKARIEYLDPITNKLVDTTIEEFESIDKNIVLLLDTSSVKNESNLKDNKRRNKANTLNKSMPLYLIGSCIVILMIYIFSQSFSAILGYGIMYMFSSLFGLALTALLLWYEIDAHNPFIREVCGGNSRKLNCNAVLASSKGSMFGISWSVWGFTFFMIFFLSMILMPGNIGQINLWSILSILISPYMFFSIFYQWKIVKQWCPLCLAIQCILMLNLIIGVSYLLTITSPLESISWYNFALTVCLGLLLLFITNSLIPIIKSSNDSHAYKMKYKKLRYNPEIFNALLEKSEQVNIATDNIGIIVGNPDAPNEIIKICNPYCTPCSRANSHLELILKRNTNYKLRIIFNAFGADWDKRTPPVQFFLAVQQEYGDSIVHTVLDEWYSTSNKNLDYFMEKYPIKANLKDFNPKIFEMRGWCNQMKIRATPTIFINNRETPNIYDIEELPNLL